MLLKTIAAVVIALNPYLSLSLFKLPTDNRTEIAPAKLPLAEKTAEAEKINGGFIFAGLSNNLASLAVSANNSAGPDFLPIRDWNISEPEAKFKAAAVTMISQENPANPEKNKILYQLNVNQVLPIASIAKIMSAVVALENLELDQIVFVSKEALERGMGDKGRLVVGEKITVGNLLRAMLVESSNDAAEVLAQFAEERIRKNFVVLMNKKAEEIGLSETRFSDPSGCDSKNVSTVKELTEMVKYALGQPIIWEILRMKTIDTMSIDGDVVHHWVNTNELLGKIDNIVGGKTGFTDGAGGCMVLVTEKIQRENESADSGLKKYLIAVVLGAEERFSETKKLINWIDEAYRW